MPWWKRGFDLVVATLLIVALAPVLLAVALYIRLVSPGPVLFIQERVGLGGTAFPILKFRSMMHRAAPSDEEHRRHVTRLAQTQAPLVKPDVGDCLIPGGEWLRRLSLDELPQLFNVLKGEMSLIGPRPDVLRFTDYTPRQLRRFAVAPGMTGLWQVSGKNRLSFDQMIDLDLYYVEHRSFLLDLWILLRTIPVLWGGNGV